MALACGDSGFVSGCDFVNALVTELPHYDEVIMRDITPTDGWLLNVATVTEEIGTPSEETQDRFRGVWPNTTKSWRPVVGGGFGDVANAGCVGNPCDPEPNCLGWGAERRTFRAEEQTWESPIICYNQAMRVTHAVEHLEQITNEIFRPATTDISSAYLRKRHLQWAGTPSIPGKIQCNAAATPFTYQWAFSDPAQTEEGFFDCSCDPANVFLLSPQFLQNLWQPLMLGGYAGHNPFKDTVAYIELVTSADTGWQLDKLATTGGVPSPAANWRFTQWDAGNQYWRYGFSGMIGNFLWRADEMGLRFNYVTDLGAGAHGGNGNRYRYQLLQPYYNEVTPGAGGAPGIGRVPNPAFKNARYQISQIHHKQGFELKVPAGGQLNPSMPFGHISFGGQWKWLDHDLGADASGRPIVNKWGNKGQYGAWFQYKIRPMHTEHLRAIFHERETFCVPEIHSCQPDTGYPALENYNSCLPQCGYPAIGPVEPSGEFNPEPTPTP